MGIKVVGDLKYDDIILYKEDSNRYKMIVHIRMNDECKNNICILLLQQRYMNYVEVHGNGIVEGVVTN